MRLIQTAIINCARSRKLAGGAQMAGFRAVRHFLRNCSM